jgi:hypothetical protein
VAVDKDGHALSAGGQHRMKSITIAASFFYFLTISDYSTFAYGADPDPPRLDYDIKGKREILLNQKFVRSETKALTPTAKPLGPGDGYASVRFSIGTTAQKANLTKIVENMALALPAKFGNSAGTYIINVTLTDAGGKVLVKEPILSFQWTRERQLFFIDKTVSDVRKTSWTGTLIDRMLVNPANQRLKVSIEASLQQDRSLDFDLIKKTAQAYSSSVLASYLPLSAAALPMINSLADLLNGLYAKSIKQDLVDEDEFSLVQANPAKRADIVFTDEQQNKYAVPVLIVVGTQASILTEDGTLTDGRFDKAKISETIFNNTQLQIAQSQNVSLVELITSSSDPRYKATRTMLDAVIAGNAYGRDSKEQDASVRCGDLYDALNTYLSKYDARAMFWAFIQKYGEQLPKSCLNVSRKTELDSVGLGP